MAVKGVGVKLAQRIVDRFGEESLDVIENHPQQLAQISGITAKKALEINSSFCRRVGIRRLMEYLNVYHLPPELAVRLYGVYGELSRQALEDNPYLLTEEYFGADFSVVDAYALQTGVSGDDERRVEAGILFELTYNLTNGHTFLPMDKLLQATAALLELDGETVQSGALRLLEQGRLVTDQIAGLTAAYLPQYYEAETYLTGRLLEVARQRTDSPPHPERLLRAAEQKQPVQYAALQRQAVLAAAEHGLLIGTGGPGTGKTTTLAGILAMFDAMGLKTLLAAPTGRAAKRLSELTGREAATIHRLLEVDVSPQTGEMTFVHDEDEPLQCDAVIVDETSMVDLLLMYALVRALPENCRLILAGDPDQLPSVGAGNVFADLIRSGRIETVRLTEIFRQAQQSLIVMNAHAVNRGEMPLLSAKDRDFFFLRRTTGAAVAQTITDLGSRRLPRNMGIQPGDIQVLSPTRKGEAGTAALNRALQAVLNPPSADKKEKTFGDFSFREGDRVMQIRNNYDIMWKKTDGTGVGTGIFNGDIGTIEEIRFEQERLRIRFDDRQADYSFDMLSELEPAYAMTVHKSQGSEHRAVILSVFRGSPYLLTRSILYTAITRARELLILVGSEEVIQTMVNNNRQTRRFSGLKWRLARQLP